MPAVAPLTAHWEHSSSFDEPSSSSLRIIVAGDAAVGKTRLCELICSGTCRRNLGDLASVAGTTAKAAAQQDWTCGASLSILRDTVDVEFRSVEVEAELWEVGGTQTYACARPVFYDGVDAVVLVYDVLNMKSYHNLVAWLYELSVSDKPPSLKYWDTGGGSGGVMDVELADGGALRQNLLSGRCPVLFVANKCDHLQDPRLRGSMAKAMPRPQPPERPSIISRILLGAGGDSSVMHGTTWRSSPDAQLVDQLCDFIQRGRHTEACCREGSSFFDLKLWNDFIKMAYMSKHNIIDT
eukprot:TRINITY_DN42862_c0_g1_i1.p1 TRINITY_DN42862_c0_g1~~TRINITY_DN42862_c0_g1_i1.p1  ORF type:complete len:296 (-),score=55.20 TRINITY_DN42862_c0_g1_i1:234-1121(-)